MRIFKQLTFTFLTLTWLLSGTSYAIMAGSASGDPADSPANRVDTTDQYSGVGAISASGSRRGTCSALSNNWALTAAHVVNGASSATVYFTTGGNTYSYTTSQFYTYDYNGDTYNPSTNDYDVALVYIPEGITNLVETYSLYSGTLHTNTTVTIVGYGGSGYGDVGVDYSTYPISNSTRRYGSNVIDALGSLNGVTECTFYQMDFDDPNTGNGLGNDVETTLTVGDSGSPALLKQGSTYYVAGVNTLVAPETEGGNASLFGGLALGISISDVSDWINYTMATVPEPSSYALLLSLFALPYAYWRKKK